jgi:hypothetical protein
MVTRKSAVEKPEHPLSVTFRLRSGWRSASGSGYIDVIRKRTAAQIEDRWTLGFRRLPRKQHRRRCSSGDGRLAYGEDEAYYSYKLNRWSALIFDYQFIADPAYNADRGPVSIFSARAHAEF